VLAGLAVPAINGALERAKQTSDVANARQLGIVLFQVANDENGAYPIGPRNNSGTRDAANNSIELFNGLLKDKDLTDPKVLATNGRTPYNGSLTNPDLKPSNVGWDYLRGASTVTDSSLPLIISTKAASGASALKSDITLTGGNQAPWGKKGIVIYTIGQSASFLKANGSGVVKAPASSDADVSGLTLIPVQPE
jgi:hypothetical protein